MKQLKLLLALGVISYMAASCSSTVPLTATENEVGEKTGTSSNTCLATWGGYSAAARYQGAGTGQMPTSYGLCFNSEEYGIHDAAQSAGIEKVATVDLKTTWYVLWTEYELQVTGK